MDDLIDAAKANAVMIGGGVLAMLTLYVLIAGGHKLIAFLKPHAAKTPTPLDDKALEAGDEILDRAGEETKRNLPLILSLLLGAKKSKPKGE